MGGSTTVVDDFVKDVSNTLTQITQPIEKAVTAGVEDTTKNLSASLQPLEKDVTQAVADTSKDLTSALQPVEKVVNYIGAHPEIQLAIILAVAVPVVGEYVGAELMASGVLTSAEAASAAAVAQGANAAQAAAAAQAATVTANTIGIAIASTTAQVAQGVPLEKAIENVAADVAVSKLSPAAAKQLDTLLTSPAVTDAVVSTVASAAATAARGGSQEEVEKAMTAGLAGSAASSAYKAVAKTSPDIYSKAIGGATAGAVKGGTEGAVVGALSSASGALASEARKPTRTDNQLDTGGGEDFETYSDPSTTIEINPRPVAPLDITPDQTQESLSGYVAPLDIRPENQTQAETERLARQNEILNLISPTEAPETQREPAYLGELPEVTITGTREEPYTPEITLPPKDTASLGLTTDATETTTKPPTADIVPPPSTEEPDVAEEEAPAEEAPADKPSTYRPDIFVTTYKKPKSGGSMATLGAALGTAGVSTGLTSSRGAGEIEGTGTGGKRKKVWNEESLKLKDALGV
jgi:hypothetical protein